MKMGMATLLGAFIVAVVIITNIADMAWSAMEWQMFLSFAIFPVFAMLSKTQLCKKIGSAPAWGIGLVLAIIGKVWVDKTFYDLDAVSTALDGSLWSIPYHYVYAAQVYVWAWPAFLIFMMTKGFLYGGREIRRQEEEQEIIAKHEALKKYEASMRATMPDSILWKILDDSRTDGDCAPALHGDF
jgi:hypothetical protein